MTGRGLMHCGVALLAGLLGACAPFDPHWKDAGAGRQGKSQWDGKWISEKHHEDGHLRCVLEPRGQDLAAHFHANWLIFSNNFDMVLSPAPGPRRAGALAYRGTQDLPAIFGGTYRYDATLEKDRFTAHYTSSSDYGVFALKRVVAAKEAPETHAGH